MLPSAISTNRNGYLVTRAAIVLYREKHEPIGAFGAMFRCAARLQLQYPRHLWRAAFREHPPYLAHITRECQRYGAHECILVPWQLESHVAEAPPEGPCTPALSQHPLMHAIVTQRTFEAHYTHQPQVALAQAASEQTWYVHATHAPIAGIASMSVTTMATRLHTAAPTHPLVIQPLALSQLDPLIGQIQAQIVAHQQRTPIYVAKAIEYDRRLLEIVTGLVRPHLQHLA